MAYIQKMVIQGFKSFAKKTEVLFDPGINVVIGPNGSGKSNISDALCFALGRLSIKSMRAAKAKNLIFMGSKYVKPAREAVVDLHFDNSDNSFNIDSNVVVLTRIVRVNGQSIYKINGETKTRGEVVDLLAHAGIDPYGFNLILQGQIQAIVKMQGDERRKIIEEVAGISIYESRKEKSIKELEKTDEKLKEIGTVLRERGSYLKNLEKEKSQAERFKELQETVKRAKAGIFTKKRDEKLKEIENIEKGINERGKEKDNLRDNIQKFREEIDVLSEKIEKINKEIQNSTGLEQDKLYEEISNLKAEIEGLRVRKESFDHRREEFQRRIDELEKSIPSLESEIKDMKEKSPLMAKKAEELRKKKEELSMIENDRRKALSFKSELNSLRERVKDKERQHERAKIESEEIINQVERIGKELKYSNQESCDKKVKELEDEAKKLNIEWLAISQKELENTKTIGISEAEIERSEKIKKNVSEIDTCPLCQSELSMDHKEHVEKDSNEKIEKAINNKENAIKELEEIRKRKTIIDSRNREINLELKEIEREIEKHLSVSEKTEQIKKAVENEKKALEELKEFEEKLKKLESNPLNISEIEEKYDSKIMEIEEISSRTDQNLDNALIYKQRELENTLNIIKRSKSEIKELEVQLKDIYEKYESRKKILESKEIQEKELNEKFKKMFEERDVLQRNIQKNNSELNDLLSESRQIEDQINFLRIGKAKLDAEKESLDFELEEFKGVEILTGSLNYLEERLKKSQEILQTIGSINMRALEVYEQVKEEYESIAEKVSKLEQEREEIMKIVEEIDKKKKRSFMSTFRAINDLFTENFSRLSTKGGSAYLEIENKEDIFNGGINIIVKLAKGKYFDVTSLSGGEQTMVALSLLFAIQEHKPYHFYIFDEIDAALDKRNSERLAGLLKQYMKSGQYIVVTHNDAIISESNLLYGVSMHEGVSKILSLKVENEDSEITDKEIDEAENAESSA